MGGSALWKPVVGSGRDLVFAGHPHHAGHVLVSLAARGRHDSRPSRTPPTYRHGSRRARRLQDRLLLGDAAQVRPAPETPSARTTRRRSRSCSHQADRLRRVTLLNTSKEEHPRPAGTRTSRHRRAAGRGRPSRGGDPPDPAPARPTPRTPPDSHASPRALAHATRASTEAYHSTRASQSPASL